MTTAASLLDQQTSVLRTQLDGVYGGAIDSVHNARVTTRRIRELLSLVTVKRSGKNVCLLERCPQQLGKRRRCFFDDADLAVAQYRLVVQLDQSRLRSPEVAIETDRVVIVEEVDPLPAAGRLVSRVDPAPRFPRLTTRATRYPFPSLARTVVEEIV
jgi:hypothetical protein